MKLLNLTGIACMVVLLVGCISTAEKREEDLSHRKIETVHTPQWPFNRPVKQELSHSGKKVFAHYFPQFPVSIDNKPSDRDYYQRGYLAADGERNKHLKYGGFLRQRPLPRPVRTGDDWRLQDMREEVRLASDAGLDGFAFDILGVGDSSHWKRLLVLLEAAKLEEPDFRIMLMPDMMAVYRRSPEKLVPSILSLADHPSLFRLGDGRLVISPYMASNMPPEWWQEQLDAFKAAGVDVALVPVFQAWWKYADDYSKVSHGFADWGAGTADEIGSRNRSTSPVLAHKYGKIWFAPVRPQDSRPKSFLGFEAHNTRIWRSMWDVALKGNAEWVQLITWNDYSEASEIAPSTGTQYLFYDLTAYYTTWFKLGMPPVVERDALYYCYRRQATDLLASKQAKPFQIKGKRPYNEIELIAMLREPGKISIAIGDSITYREGQTGLNVFRVPLKPGIPIFSLERDGQMILSVKGKWSVVTEADYQNLLYHGGGGTVERMRMTQESILSP